MTQTIIIPKGSNLQLLPFSLVGCKPLLELNLSIAGLSDMAQGYLADVPSPHHHRAIYFLEGEGVVVINGVDVVPSPGTLGLFPAGHALHIFHSVPGTWKLLWWELEDSFPWCGLNRLKPMLRNSHVLGELRFATEALLAEAVRIGGGSREYLNLLSLQIGFLLRRDLFDGETQPEWDRREQLNLLWQEILGDLARPWTITSLAAKMHLSPVHFRRLVHKYHGKTPRQVLYEFRMHRAEELLTAYMQSVQWVASKVGYNDSFAFSRAFKRYAGKSPRHFRNRGA